MQKISAVALMAAAISISQCCTGDFYQPEVPDELKQYLKINQK